MKKYIVQPGGVTSKSGGDWHFIDGWQLLSLYQVNPKECLILPSIEVATKHFKASDGKFKTVTEFVHYLLKIECDKFAVEEENLIWLKPLYDGHYREWLMERECEMVTRNLEKGVGPETVMDQDEAMRLLGGEG